MSKTKTHEEFVSDMNLINPDLEILGCYKNSKTNILVRCKKCGHEWEPRPCNLLRGISCLKCSYEMRGKNTRMTVDEFYQRLDDTIHVEVIGDWNGVSEKVRMKCLDCNYEWDVVPSSLLRGYHCPNCSKSGTSFMEQVLLYSILAVFDNDSVVHRSRSLIGKELDIYIPSMKLAVEIGSWYWHKSKYQNDLKKKELCNAVGVRLIIIYDSFDDSDVVSDSDIWIYHENFSEERYHDVLKTVVERIYRIFDVSNDLLSDMWSDILQKAFVGCRQMTTDEFKSELIKIRPDIEVLGDFHGMHNSISVRCKTCGFVWKSIPTRLLSGYGCRKCGRKVVADKLSLSKDEYIEKLKSVNSDILVVGEYVNMSSHIDVKCLRCGYEWSPVASSLTSQGRGCPNCWESRRGSYLKSNHEEFLDKFQKKGNVNIAIIGTYKTSKEPIEVKCKLCGREWFSTPNQLLRGSGCIVCAGTKQKTHEEFVFELASMQPDLTLLSEYVCSDSKVKVRCNVCDYEWDVRAVNLVKKGASGCPKCGHKRAGQKNGRTTEQYVEELRCENSNIEVLEDYVNANTKILHRCSICNHEFTRKPSYFLNYHRGCPVCNSK